MILKNKLRKAGIVGITLVSLVGSASLSGCSRTRNIIVGDVGMVMTEKQFQEYKKMVLADLENKSYNQYKYHDITALMQIMPDTYIEFLEREKRKVEERGEEIKHNLLEYCKEREEENKQYRERILSENKTK